MRAAAAAAGTTAIFPRGFASSLRSFGSGLVVLNDARDLHHQPDADDERSRPPHHRGRRPVGVSGDLRPWLPRALLLVAPSAPGVAEAGYHAIAPDGRGYGKSSRPEAIEDYDITKLTGDLIGRARRPRQGAGHLRGSRLGRDRRVEPRRPRARTSRRRRGHERAVRPPAHRTADRADCGRSSATTSSTCSISRSRESRTPTSAMTSPRRCAGSWPVRPSVVEAAWRRCSPPASWVSWSVLPNPTACPTGSARTNSTTTSPSSAGPASPAASTGTGTSIATGASPSTSPGRR